LRFDAGLLPSWMDGFINIAITIVVCSLIVSIGIIMIGFIFLLLIGNGFGYNIGMLIFFIIIIWMTYILIAIITIKL
jgi:hypothetical protein